MQKHFNLEYLNTFLIAAETGRLNVTAEIVYRSHSTVSTQIKQLEKQVDTTLFIRNKDTLVLTKHGQILLEYAKSILQLNEDAFSSLENHYCKGNMSLGIPTDYSQLFVTYIYPQLCHKLPDYRFITTCSRSREIRKQINEGKVNIALVAMEPQYPDDLLLWEEPLYWICSKDFDYDKKQPLPISLFNDNCIIHNHSLYCLKKSNIDFKIIFSSTVLDNTLDSVKAGMAVSLLPASAMDSDLQIVDKEYLFSPFKLKIGCAWDQHYNDRDLQTAINCIKEGISHSKYNEFMPTTL